MISYKSDLIFAQRIYLSIAEDNQMRLKKTRTLG